MFKEGHIYRFKSFVFRHGDSPKEKYFIVLKEIEDRLIIGTLPTRTNKIPVFVNIEHGCVYIEESQYNCYLFQKNKSICENDFCFDMTTFIYGDDLEYYEIEKMLSNYPDEGKDYITMGKLINTEFNSILDCFRKSNAVKRGIRKQIQ